MKIRIDRALQEDYNDLSAKTNRFRNELISMALRYALDHMELQERNKYVLQLNESLWILSAGSHLCYSFILYKRLMKYWYGVGFRKIIYLLTYKLFILKLF